MAPSNLQVSKTGIKFRTSSNFSHIVQVVLKLPLSAIKSPLTFFRDIALSLLTATFRDLQFSVSALYLGQIKFWLYCTIRQLLALEF